MSKVQSDKAGPSSITAYVVHVLVSPVVAGLASWIVTMFQSGYSPRYTFGWFIGPDYVQWVAPVSLVLSALMLWPLWRKPLARVVGMLTAAAAAVITNAMFFPGSIVR